MDNGIQTTKISELPEAITLNESDYSLIVQNGTSKKIKGLLLKGNAGDNGKSIEIQKTDTHIQWRQEGGQWINLVALADLKGDKGEQGEGANVDLTDYATKVWVAQQLASYYTKAEIDLSLSNKANISHAHTEYASIDHAHNYNDLTNKPTIPSKTSDLTNDSDFLTSIPSEYVTEEEMNTALSNKANKSDIPSLDGYATENFVTTKISEAQLSGGEVDLSGYATKTYVDNAIDTALDGHTFKFLTQAEYDALETKDPLVEYHITDITDTGEGITTEQAQQLQTAYEHSQSVHVQASDIPTKTSDIQNDSGFITSIPEEYITETELINKVAKGYRVAIRQTSYGTGMSFVFDGGNDIKYVKDDKITVNFRCRHQYFFDDGGLGLFNKTNNALIYFGQFKNNNNPIGYLKHYNASVTATNTGYINDLRFDVYKKLDFEIQDIYVKINDEVYYPKRLWYPETTIVEETPLVVDDNSIATKSFVEDLIRGIHKQDFELPFVNNIYTVKSSQNFFGVPIFLDYLYGKFKGTDRIIFDTDNDRQYVYPLMYLNKSMVNTKVNYKVKSETLNVPNVKFNHICIDENLNTDNIRLLIIGDSVTAGAITKQQYWSVCAEHFAKEDIIRNRDSKFMCLGSNNFRTTTVEFNGKTKEVTAGACGISSWSLNTWLTNVSNTTNYDNPGGLNGFTYVDNGVTKFSILKWIERFRNYDDNGNKLELGNGTGTWINANNINKIKCCTPNVIYINSTHNGGTIEQHEEIINIIKQELPNCKVIVGNPMPLLGSYYPDKYVDEWIDDSLLRQLPNYGGEGNYLSTRLNSLKYYVKKEKEDTTNSFYFMPQVVITPTIEGYEYDLVDNGFKQMKKITTQSLPKEHPGTLAHKIWGYELYSLLKYISGVEQGATNNFDTVPLFEISE